ncbi:MAG: hypothetical protein KJZ78_19530, partial [Bryobacteraceae bacterium]|nr:hypothetical protein [Bryobacteraceae bacterium]
MVETETPSETTSKYLPTTPTPADPYFFLYSLGPEQVTTFLKTMEYYPTLKSPSPNKGAHLDICLGRCFCSFLVNDAEGLEIVRKLNLELGGLRPGYRGSLGDGWTHFYVSPLQVIQTENGMATSDFKTIVLVKEISEAKSDDLARRKTLAEEIRTKLEGVATGNNPAPKVPISVATTGGYYDVCLVFGAGHDDAAKYIQAIRDTRRFQTYTIPAISWKSIFPKGGTDSEREERTALVNLEITVRPGYMHEAIQHLKIDLGECDVHPSAEFRVMPGHKDAICGPHRVRIIPFVRRLLNRYGKSDTYFLATRTLPIIEWQGIQVPLSGDGNKDSDTVASAVQIKAQPISPWDIPTVVGGYDWTPRYKWTLERNGCYQGFHRATADAFGAAASRDSWSGPDRADIVPRLIHGCAPPYTGRPVGGNAPGDSKFPMLRDIFISHGVLLLDDPEPVIEHEL